MSFARRPPVPVRNSCHEELAEKGGPCYYICTPFEPRMKADIFLPSCKFDCRLLIRTSEILSLLCFALLCFFSSVLVQSLRFVFRCVCVFFFFFLLLIQGSSASLYPKQTKRTERKGKTKGNQVWWRDKKKAKK